MNKLYIVVGIIIIIIILFRCNTFSEGFRGRRRFHGGAAGRGGWPGLYLNRFRRRNNGWFGHRRPFWNDFYFYPSMFNDYWGYAPCNCKRGCTPEGCTYPGTGINDCVWSTDCNCCGF